MTRSRERSVVVASGTLNGGSTSIDFEEFNGLETLARAAKPLETWEFRRRMLRNERTSSLPRYMLPGRTTRRSDVPFILVTNGIPEKKILKRISLAEKGKKARDGNVSDAIKI